MKLWKANYLDNWKCVYLSLLTFHLLRMRSWSCGRPTTWTTGSVSIPHFFHLIYCACAGEAVEGQLPGQLEVCLSLTSYISFIAHAQVKLWKANYLDNWKCVYPSLLTFPLLRMRSLSCGRPTIWTTGSVSIPHFLQFIYCACAG